VPTDRLLPGRLRSCAPGGGRRDHSIRGRAAHGCEEERRPKDAPPSPLRSRLPWLVTGLTYAPVKLFLFGAGATYGTLGRRGVKGFGRELAGLPRWRGDPLYSALAPYAKAALKKGETDAENWDLDVAWTSLDYFAKLRLGLDGLGLIFDEGAASVAIHRAAAAAYGPLDHDYLSRAWHGAVQFTLREILKAVTPGDVVASFNWDVLVEHLLVQHRLCGTSIRLVQAPHRAGGDVVTIAKPHGSLSWGRHFPQQGDAADFLPGPDPLLEPMLPADISDQKQPLLLGAVPIKSELLVEVQQRHPWVHTRVMQQWSALCVALRDADELHVVGYGFPVEDGYGLFMLREAVKLRSRPCRVFLYEVPGRRCDEVAANIARLLELPDDKIGRRGPVLAPDFGGRGPSMRAQVADAAYFRWRERDSTHGQDLDDWFKAERDFGRQDSVRVQRPLSRGGGSGGADNQAGGREEFLGLVGEVNDAASADRHTVNQRSPLHQQREGLGHVRRLFIEIRDSLHGREEGVPVVQNVVLRGPKIVEGPLCSVGLHHGVDRAYVGAGRGQANTT
jgi:hypothetical protein